MVSKRTDKPIPNRPVKQSKPQINRKRPEKSNGGTIARSKAIRKRRPVAAVRSPPGILQTARSDRRTVLLDACNIAFVRGSLPRFSVERLVKALEYFFDRGHAVHAIFPRFHLYTRQWDDLNRLDGLYRKGYIVPTPCKEFPCPKSQVYDDRILMAIAAQFQCAVVSMDRFRDVASEHPDWAHVAHNQRVEFEWRGDGRFVIPSQFSSVLNFE
uniref:RNase_Zc3h12a domain-containing protein n=1 Tax=Anopheles epiroticus TaxID=199890 RepID=A0A182PSM8_9DIPT